RAGQHRAVEAVSRADGLEGAARAAARPPVRKKKMNRSTHPVENEELMAYLDGELAVERARDVASHLEQCAECQALAADFRFVYQQMATWEAGPSPAGLAERVTAAAEAHSPNGIKQNVREPLFT